MKLLLCKKCSDIVSLRVNKIRTCECGLCGGKYVDDVNAEFYGEHAFLIGFANSTLVNALRHQINLGDREDGMGRDFIAFIIPESAPSVKRINKEKYGEK